MCACLLFVVAFTGAALWLGRAFLLPSYCLSYLLFLSVFPIAFLSLSFVARGRLKCEMPPDSVDPDVAASATPAGILCRPDRLNANMHARGHAAAMTAAAAASRTLEHSHPAASNAAAPPAAAPAPRAPGEHPDRRQGGPSSEPQRGLVHLPRRLGRVCETCANFLATSGKKKQVALHAQEH
jgi:hypothetical protein